MRFIHTSDWHIGKTFPFADEASQGLREERLDAVTRIGELAAAEGVPDVLVAGDVYDIETPTDRTLRQPLARMRAFSGVEWWLIPGNHDADTPRGPWERLRRLRQSGELPANVHLQLDPGPLAIAGGAAYLLPSVLKRRHSADDPTVWMDGAATPEGVIRIGLAHGSVGSFGGEDATAPNRIAPNRADLAGLSYLALGDYHGETTVSARGRYSGTPETDDFSTGGEGGGTVLVIDIQGPGDTPAIARHRTGRFEWRRLDVELHNAADVDVLETRLRGLSPDLGRCLVWLRASGALSLQQREVFERRVRAGLGSALRVLRLEDSGLLGQPTPEDLAKIDHAGFVRVAADRLSAMAADPAHPLRATAADALQRLFVLTLQAPGGARP